MQFGQANYLSRPGGVRRAVVCLDRGDGRVLWTCEALHQAVGMLHRDNSPATPTPVADDRGVYAAFGGAWVMAVSHRGNLLWTSPGLRFDTVFGFASSPVLCDDALVIVADEPDAPYVTALDAASGRRLWTRDRRAFPTWVGGVSRTPHVKVVDGRKQILVWGRGDLAAYDASTGGQVWSFPLESDGDAVAGAVFDDERAYLWKSPGVVIALTLSKLSAAARSGRFDEAVAWQRRLSACPNCASPVLSGGMLFVVSDLGVASCLDASTGELRGRRRLEGPCMASPTAAGGRVYVPSNSGTMTVVTADAKFEVVAENDQGERLYASPAIVDGQMILRTESHLFCIDDRAPPSRGER